MKYGRRAQALVSVLAEGKNMAFCNLVGEQKVHLTQVLADKKKFSPKTLRRLAEMNINPKWVSTGKGEMISDSIYDFDEDF
ncbi:MAG: hypothetical protein COB67_06885 [SAR324 cluster bacterium]|uniref:Uncharacterized protein n=1 Tax=SAR324 cluster bacterium TaxID=2024889 RepID=A0A2A4T529_9DELT|nr:MAG: hypothetical protein COB67_06885 [SAR324 cluster bacterium]